MEMHLIAFISFSFHLLRKVTTSNGNSILYQNKSELRTLVETKLLLYYRRCDPLGAMIRSIWPIGRNNFTNWSMLQNICSIKWTIIKVSNQKKLFYIIIFLCFIIRAEISKGAFHITYNIRNAYMYQFILV